MKSAIIAVLASAAAASPSLAERWRVEIGYAPGNTSVNPAAVSCKVRISAEFRPGDYAFAAGRFDIGAGVSGHFFGVPSGRIVPWGVRDITVGQAHFPPFVLANPAHPIVVWEGEWTTTNFRTRLVSVVTDNTSKFDVYRSAASPLSTSRLATLREGRATIRVVGGIPAPGAGVVVGGSLLAAVRRRRR